MLQFDDLVSKDLTIAVNGVKDTAGNIIAWPVMWTFTVADFGASSATVYVSGLLLSTTYASFQSSQIAALKAELNALLNLADRIDQVIASEAADGSTALHFTITSGTPSATVLGKQLATVVASVGSAPLTSTILSKLTAASQVL